MVSISRTCSCIYIIQNLENGKVYIGSAVDVLSRWHTHRTKLRNGSHANKHLSGAWRQYGESAFCFYILEIVDVKNDLIDREQFWINTYAANDPKKGYNLRLKAHSNLGLKASDETRALISAKHKGNKHALGTKQSQETIDKRMKTLAGIKKKPRSTPYTEAERQRRSAALKGRPGRKGIKQSEEFKRKVSEGMRRSKGKTYEGFVSPEGVEYPPIDNLKEFCIAHNLIWHCMVTLYKGMCHSHLGWTIKGRPIPVRFTSRQAAAEPKQDMALALKREGYTYEAIAKKLGYADRTGAHVAVKAALKRLNKK